MKHKSIIAAILLLSAAQTAYCETTVVADTVFKYRGNTIDIKENGNELDVKVFNNELNNKPYYEARYSSNKRSVRWELSDNVDISFGSIFKRKKDRQQPRRFNSHLRGFQFGFCDVLNANEDINIVLGKSHEFAFNLISADINLPVRNFGLALGIGLDWRKYYMDGNEYFRKQDGRVEIANHLPGEHPHYSRLKTFSIALPILLEWQPGRRGNIFFAAGGIINITTSSSIKNSYDDTGGHLRKHTNHEVYHNPLNIDFQAMAGYRHIAIYAKYTARPVLDTSKAPKMHGLSYGVQWAF